MKLFSQSATPLPTHWQCNSDPPVHSAHSVHSPMHWAHWVDQDRGGALSALNALSALSAPKPHSAVILMWDRWIYLYLRRYRTRPQTSRFNFRQSKQSSFFVFGVFVDSRGRGNPCKTYSWGSILTFFDKVFVLIFDHQSRTRSMFLEFL